MRHFKYYKNLQLALEVKALTTEHFQYLPERFVSPVQQIALAGAPNATRTVSSLERSCPDEIHPT
jgi:hypothetical protein